MRGLDKFEWYAIDMEGCRSARFTTLYSAHDYAHYMRNMLGLEDTEYTISIMAHPRDVLLSTTRNAADYLLKSLQDYITSLLDDIDDDVIYYNQKDITDLQPYLESFFVADRYNHSAITSVSESFKFKKYAACVLILNDDDEILSVSRKDDHDDWGLPGGKCEYRERPSSAAIRETLEETGYTVEVHACDCFVDTCADGTTVYTFLAVRDVSQLKEIESHETGLVQFRSREDLENGSFGEYNKKCFSYFMD